MLAEASARALVSHLVTTAGKALHTTAGWETSHVSTISQYLHSFLPGGALSRDLRQMMLNMVFNIKTDPRLPGEQLLKIFLVANGNSSF